MRLLITGAAGFLGWRCAVVLTERGHEIVAVTRPRGARREQARELGGIAVDAGSPEIRALIDGCDAVLHFAGVPDPARARRDPARAVRENAGTTLNLLEGCLQSGAGLVYPSTIRAAGARPPDPYALSKRLGEELCALHDAPAAVVRMTSVFGPGQVAWEGATGAIAAFAARALRGEPLVIPGDPQRTRDFVYVDDVVVALEALVAGGDWGCTSLLASGTATPLIEAARLAVAASGSESAIETPGGALEAAENASYEMERDVARLPCPVRPLQEGVERYVQWLRRHCAAQGSARA